MNVQIEHDPIMNVVKIWVYEYSYEGTSILRWVDSETIEYVLVDEGVKVKPSLQIEGHVWEAIKSVGVDGDKLIDLYLHERKRVDKFIDHVLEQ